MNLTDLNPPFIELPEHQVWHRIQRTRARSGSVRMRGFILPPAGTLSGRFDLSDETTAYLADGELTALYESLFRREARSCHLDRLKKRTLSSFRTTSRLRVDLRGLEESFSVLSRCAQLPCDGGTARMQSHSGGCDLRRVNLVLLHHRSLFHRHAQARPALGQDHLLPQPGSAEDVAGALSD